MVAQASQNRRDNIDDRLINLLVEIQCGQKSAFDSLFELTSAKLYAICLRYCGEATLADDALQETYVKIWNRADRFTAGDASPMAWLSVIARNAAIDCVRKVRGGVISDDRVLEAVPDNAPLADVKIEEREQRERIEECLGKLPAQQAEPIRSAFFSGFTYAQLAKQTDTPLSNLKSRIRRGLQLLKKCLTDDE